jgi:hypothetical protein
MEAEAIVAGLRVRFHRLVCALMERLIQFN